MKILLIVSLAILTACSQSNPNKPEPVVVDNSIPYSSANLQAVSSIDFGIIKSKATVIKTVQIFNDQSELSSVTNVSLSGTDSDKFSIIYKHNCDKVLQKEEKCTVKVSISNNRLSVSAVSSQLVVGDLMIDLTAQPEIASLGNFSFVANNSEVNELDFGSIATKSVTKKILLKNNNPYESEVANLNIDSLNFTKISDSCSGKILGSQKTCIVSLYFDAKGKVDGNYIGNLSFGDKSLNLKANVSGGIQSNAPSFKSLDVFVNNNVSSDVDFGYVSKNEYKIVTVKNTGSLVHSPPSINQSSSDFEVVYSNCNQPLAPNKTCSIRMLFNPSGKNPAIYNSVLSVENKTVDIEARIQPTCLVSHYFDHPSFSCKIKTYNISISKPAGSGSISDASGIVCDLACSNIIKTVDYGSNLNLSFSENNEFDLVSWQNDSLSCSNNLNCSLDNIISDKVVSLTVKSSKPIITSATLSGPYNQLSGQIYYTSNPLGNEIIPQVTVEDSRPNSGAITLKYSKTSDCSVTNESSSFSFNSNQLNNLFVQAEDSLGNKSDCSALGSVVHDNISPAISFSQPSVNSYLLNSSNQNSLSYSFLYSLIEINPSITILNSYTTQSCTGSATIESSFSSLAVLKNGYKSVQVTHTDKAGNTTSTCSPWVFTVEPVSLTASLPAYTNNANQPISLTSAQATEMKFSTNSSCSDGTWEAFSSSKATNLNLNTSNTFYVQARRETVNLSPCLSVSTIHDNIAPNVSYNSGIGNLNLTGASNSTNINFSLTDTNLESTYDYLVYNNISCASSPSETTLANLVSVIQKTLPLNIRSGKSVKIIIKDKAQNEAAVCSNKIIYGEVDHIVLSIPSPLKLYKESKSFSGQVQDSFNNNLSGINLSLIHEAQSKTITSNGSGTFSFNVSADTLFNVDTASGIIVSHKLISQDNKFDLSVTDVPSIVSTYNYSIVRSNCQELRSYDNITVSNSYTLDPDGEGATAEYVAYCDMIGSDGWSLAAKIGSGSTNWAYANTRWNNAGSYLNETTFLPLTSGESKHKAFDFESFSKIKVVNPSGLKAEYDLNIGFSSVTSLRSLFSSANNSLATTLTYHDSELYNYVGSDALGICTSSMPSYKSNPNSFLFLNRVINYSGQATNGRVRLGAWIAGSNSYIPAQTADCGVGLGIETNSQYYGTKTAGTSANGGHSSLWVKGREYRLPVSCSDAANRKPTLIGTGTKVAIQIDTDGYNYGTAPVSQDCDFNIAGTGSYLLKNSAFSTASNIDGWATTGSGMTFNGSYLQISSPGFGYSLTKTFPTIVGKKYEYSVNVIANTSESLPYPTYKFLFNFGSSSQFFNNRFTGIVTGSFVATGTSSSLDFHCQASTGYLRYDDLVIKEVNP